MSSTAARNSFGSIKRNLWKQQSSARFNYANVAFWGVLGGGALLAYSKFDNDNHKKSNWKPLMAATGIVNVAEIPKGKGFNEYQEVYNEIAKKIHLEEDADGGVGRYGLLCRLSWHASGTYQKSDNTGGSYGGTMIHSPERLDGENKGLEVGRDFYLEIADRYPWLSRGDLWTLGGVAAVQESGGPKIPWRPGRKNLSDPKRVPDNGRLPSASEGGLYVKNLFARMGFNERETVALIGAHVLGQCHSYYSGYSGPWGPSYNMFSNDFYVRLLGDWHLKDWSGKRQYEDNETNSFMMLPTDMALKEESYFVKYVKQYAEDQDLFFNDFSKAFSTLLELGVTFPEGQKKWEFQTLDDQDIDIDDDE